MTNFDLTDWVSMMGSFLVVLGLLIATLIAIKRMGPKLGVTGSKQLRLIEVKNLGNRQKIILMSVNNHQILIGLSPQSISKLGDFPSAVDNFDTSSIDSDDLTEEPANSIDVGGFSGVLTRMLSR